MIPVRATLQTPPATEPVSLSEAKAHCRIEHGADDALIASYIAAARMACEHYTARAFLTQTWDIAYDQFPIEAPYEIMLPKGVCQSVTHVKYTDSEGVEQTLVEGTDYQVSLNGDTGARLKPLAGAAWPSPQTDTYEAVRIRAVLGWTTVPAPLVHAIKMTVAHLYENREAVVVGTTAVELPMGARALMDPYCLIHFA